MTVKPRVAKYFVSIADRSVWESVIERLNMYPPTLFPLKYSKAQRVGYPSVSYNVSIGQDFIEKVHTTIN